MFIFNEQTSVGNAILLQLYKLKPCSEYCTLSFTSYTKINGISL